MADGGCAELCKELGDFYFDRQDYEEAAIWYYNACYETEAMLALCVQGKQTITKLAQCYEEMGLLEQAARYREELVKL